jgi:hypothetical protein
MLRDGSFCKLQYVIWEAVAKFQLKSIFDVPIVIENVQIIRKCTLRRLNVEIAGNNEPILKTEKIGEKSKRLKRRRRKEKGKRIKERKKIRRKNKQAL